MRRDEIQSPTSPSAARYATLTSWNGPTVPVVSAADELDPVVER